MMTRLLLVCLGLGPVVAHAQAYDVSRVGELIIQNTIQHKLKVMELEREIELATLGVKKLKEEKEKEKLENGDDMGPGLIPVVPIQGRNGPYNQPPEAPKVEKIEAPQVVKFTVPPTIPTLVGVVGRRGLFKVGSDTVEAIPGQTVGSFVVDQITASSAVLTDKNDAKNKLTLTVQM